MNCCRPIGALQQHLKSFTTSRRSSQGGVSFQWQHSVPEITRSFFCTSLMGIQVYHGLYTTPISCHECSRPYASTAGDEFLFHPDLQQNYLSLSRLREKSGDRSIWSQVQIRSTHAAGMLYGGTGGARVGVAPPSTPEATAKNGGFIPVQQVQQLTNIKKRSLRRAVKRAQKQSQIQRQAPDCAP